MTVALFLKKYLLSSHYVRHKRENRHQPILLVNAIYIRVRFLCCLLIDLVFENKKSNENLI